VAITYEAGAGEKTSELSSRKSLMNCPCRERMQNKATRIRLFAIGTQSGIVSMQ
jgi:hypothetical protein